MQIKLKFFSNGLENKKKTFPSLRLYFERETQKDVRLATFLDPSLVSLVSAYTQLEWGSFQEDKSPTH